MTEGLKRKDDRHGSPARHAVVGCALALTAALLGYTAWQAATAPAEAVPRAEADAPEDEGAGRSVVVRLWNDGGVGILLATVEVRCGDSTQTLEFDHVPAGGKRSGRAACAEGEPEARVVAWTEA